MPRFKSNIFYQYSPKIKLFLKNKFKNFQVLDALPPDPRASSGWGLCSQTPNSHRRLGAVPPDPQMRIFGYAPATLCTVYIYMGFRSFCFEQSL